MIIYTVKRNEKTLETSKDFQTAWTKYREEIEKAHGTMQGWRWRTIFELERKWFDQEGYAGYGEFTIQADNA